MTTASELHLAVAELMDVLIPASASATASARCRSGFSLANRLKGIDLRRVGSGNVGAANVYRTAGLAIALLVVVVDVAKGAGTRAAGGAR